MIHGLEKFKEYFRGFEDQYVIIGGTACSILFNDFGTSFRSTKDIDMVLLVEVLTKEFGDKFISFVSEAGYEHMNNTAECPQYYRFSKPKKSEFPTMIELFSKSQENVL